ncbi:MotE family protein [Afifella pfennigii]|uniref:MotE family protein n=1 Tax=Afifella pfennigii TaxID=209897 RepID=UPI00068EA9D9|nr:MotE family protein [Afifella pfennigii]
MPHAVRIVTSSILLSAGLAAILAGVTGAGAQEAAPAPEAAVEAPARLEAATSMPASAPSADMLERSMQVEPGVDDNARKYCVNIADAAADARFARQTEALKALEAQINKRIEALEAKRAEYEEWLTRREEFLRKADESVVAIFTQMRPDAASQQMALMPIEAAAAILVKLKPRVASAILNEMNPTTAAQLTGTMVGLARPSDEAKTPG